MMDQQVEQNRAEISRALYLSEARRTANATRAGGDAVLENMRRVSTGEALIPSPREWLKTQLNELLGKWLGVPQTMLEGRPDSEFARPRAVAALELLDCSLEQLAAKTGDRAESTRAALTEQRAKIAAAVDHFDELGAKLDGPLALSLIERITALRSKLAGAHAARECATSETVAEAVLDIEKCWAESRSIDRDVAEAIAALALPVLPNAADFEQAKRDTVEIESLPAKRPSARNVHHAIEEGMRASASVSRLWIVYETQPEHELIKWRWRAVAERQL